MWPTRPARRGFTLVELLLVLGIIAIFGTAVSIVSVGGNLSKARDGRRDADIEGIRSALEIYRSQNRFYPDVSGSADSVLAGSLQPDFMTDVPDDPSSSQDYWIQTYHRDGASACDNTNGSAADDCLTYRLCFARETTSQASCGAASSCGSCGVACTHQCNNL